MQFKTPIAQFGAIQGKLATMATNCFVTESASYRAAYDIEQRIDQLLAEGLSHQEAELKGVEEYAIGVLSLKWPDLKMHKTVLIKDYKFMEEWDSLLMPMEMAWRDSRISESTREQMKSTVCCIGMLLKSNERRVDFMSAATAVGQELMTGGIEKVSASSSFLTRKQLIENLKKVFLMVAGAGVQNLDQARRRTTNFNGHFRYFN